MILNMVKACSLSAAILLLNSCSSFDLIPSDSLMQRVNGRGPVLVSEDNPYLAANLLLQQESKKSKELAGFLTEEGQPTAISVQQKIMQPASMTLYYKNDMKQYNMELLRGVWVIDGPFPISDSSVEELLKSQSSSQLLNEPVIKKTTQAKPLDSAEKTQKIAEIKNTPIARQHQLTPKESFDLNATDQADYEPLFDDKAQDHTKIKEALEPAEEQPADSGDTQAADIQNRALAETTPRGDVVHYISSEAESLELLAIWYTGNQMTLSRIAKANNISVDSQVNLGDQVIIPAELVKNKYIPTATDLAQIIIDRQE